MVQDQLPALRPAVGSGHGRPVLLATLSVRIEPAAERVAIESALEANVPLIVVNLMSPFPCATTMIRLQEDLEAIRRTAARASALGVPTELLMRVPAWRPLRTLLTLARERDVGLFVLGPDRGHASPGRLRRATRAVRDELDCLVWDPAWG